MSIANILVNINSYTNDGGSCNNTNNPQMRNFAWTRQVSGIPTDNILSQSQTIAVSSSVTLFTGGPTYSFLYLESDSTVTLLINGTISIVVNPFVIGTSTYSAPFMLSSDITSVEVTNSSSSNTADIFFAVVE